MPFPMKIQPIDFPAPLDELTRFESAVKPVVKSRFKRLFERQFTSVLRISTPAPPPTEKAASGGGGEVPHVDKESNNYNNNNVSSAELYFEPSSACLAKMVQNFIEGGGGNEKQSSTARCGRNRCHCFNGSCNDSY